MQYFIVSMSILLISGFIAFILNRYPKISNYVGGSGAVLSGIVFLLSAITFFYPENVSLSTTAVWKAPFASFSMGIDNLSWLFLGAIFILSTLSALFGIEYLKTYYGKKNIGSSWFMFNALVAGMAMVVVSRNALLFLLSWEIMSVSSFFLVLFEGEKDESRKAGLIYLIATHIGTLFIFVMFILLAGKSGSFEFDSWSNTIDASLASIIFLCAVIGFGTKAGFMPLHIWLPEAHPAAPTHVSALMSGVMIKTGIYGLLRVITFIGTPVTWWGYLMIGIGIVSGILGVMFALAQHDLKRLLAYHSIENIGIISIGIGIGILGMSIQNHILTALGFAGGLLHVVNHAFFKGLLFLGSGAVVHVTGTREIDILGGLLKKMPVTALGFLIGSAAICGLPPLNGFISEFLIYFASFKNILGPPEIFFISLAVIASLALIGGLAVACFTKAFGIIFLGEPRSNHCVNAHDPGGFMKIPMLILAAACVLIGLSFPLMIPFFNNIIADITGDSAFTIGIAMSEAMSPLIYIVIASVFLYLCIMIIAILRKGFLRGREIQESPTWDCGYAKPDPRMQYTASSYAQPVVDFFKGILRTEKHVTKITEYFPDSSSFKTETSDLFSEKVFRPILKIIHNLSERLTWVQHGHLQIYILYILFTLVALFIWKL